MRLSARIAGPLIVVVLCGVFVAQGTRSVVSAQEETLNRTQTRMRGVFLSLSTAYKFSLDPDAFQNPDNRDAIESSLQGLVSNANQLESHGGGLDPSFDYLRRSLARDAGDALKKFNDGQYVGARFLISKLTENCVTCHSKLPSSRHFEIGAKFLKQAKVDDLPPLARVDIEIATRQFDRAMKTYEAIFKDPKQRPQTLLLVGAFEEYLRLCISVRNEPARAVKTLEEFKERGDVPSNLSRMMTAWINDLQNLDLASASGNELFVARQKIEHARATQRFAQDRTPLVDFISAATLLHEYLRAGGGTPVEKAEAYYLLAVAEANISRSYWVSEAPSLLEQSIAQAPKSAVAKEAYAFFEAYTLAGQSVTAREVPEHVQATLDSLRALIE